ncbi:MAG: hypothetical protein J1G30_02010 [Spirochaetales bacterium]|nr:hypothetical protein [Spirochaetales bacterium]
MIKLVKVKILDDMTVCYDGRYYVKFNVIEMKEKEAEQLAKSIQIEILKNNNVKISDGMNFAELHKYNLKRQAERGKAKKIKKSDSNDLERLLQKMEKAES